MKTLLNSLDFVEMVEQKKLTVKEKKILKEMSEAVDFVNSYNKKTSKVKTFNQLVKEL